MAKRPQFHALYFTLGPGGRQDVHLHPRIDRENEVDVLVGFGKTCDGTPGRLHVQKRLTLGNDWSGRSHEGEPLAGPVGREPEVEAVTDG